METATRAVRGWGVVSTIVHFQSGHPGARHDISAARLQDRVDQLVRSYRDTP
jgi:hypothetical protein